MLARLAARLPFPWRRCRAGAIATLLMILTQSAIAPPLEAETYHETLKPHYQSIVDSFAANLQAVQQSGDTYSEMSLWHNYGLALNYLGEFEQAREALMKALGLARSLPPEHRAFEASVVHQLVTVYNNLKDPFGIAFLESQLQQDLDRDSRRVILERLVIGYQQLGRDGLMPHALQLGQEWITLTQADGEPHELIQAWSLVASLQYAENPADAIALMEKAVAMAPQLDEPWRNSSVNSTAIQLASFYHGQDQSDRAIALLDRTIAQINPETSDRAQDLWLLLMMQAGFYRDLQAYDKAAELNEQRVAIARQLVAKNGHLQLVWALQDLAEMTFWQNDFTGAIAYQQEAHQALVAEQKRLGQFPEPETSLGNALSHSLHRLGYLNFRLGNLDAAEAALRQALDYDALLREEVLTNTNLFNDDRDQLTSSLYVAASDIHRLLLRIYLQQGDEEQALIASEQGRARGFLQLIKERFGSEPGYFDLEPPNLTEIRAIAQRENSVLVQYGLIHEYPYYWRYGFGQHKRPGAAALAIWVIQPDGAIAQRSVSLSEIDVSDLIRTTQRRIASSRRGNRAAEQLQSLHEVLITPIADLLPQDPAARVTFIPDDDLFFVPFPALQDQNGIELIEKHTILTAPSIQMLGESRRKKSKLQPSDRVFVLGNPTMPEIPDGETTNRDQLAPLPGAEEEAKKIATLFNTEPLIGDVATESNAIAQMQDARILHFATHGLLESGSYANSLAMTPTDTEDGFLMVREIIRLKLNADIAVLSACDTGRGSTYQGSEGVIGLSRAFIGAGAASVVVSLWAIPDQPTAELMEQFYRNIDAGQDKATALRGAMLKTRETHPNPVNWAAFTIMGAVD